MFKRVSKWWDGDIYADNSHCMLFIGLNRLWLRRMLEEHSGRFWTGAGSVILLVFGKLLDKWL